MFTATLGYGGSESAFLRLAIYLAQQMDVTIALMARDYGSHDYVPAQTDTDLPVEILDNEPANSRGPLAKFARWVRMLKRLRRIKKENDVTISFLSGPNLLNAIAGPEDKTIISERGSKSFHTGLSKLQKFIWTKVLDPIAYRRSVRIVPASFQYAEEIRELAGLKNDWKIHPIEGGINGVRLLQKSNEKPDSDIMDFCKAPTLVYCGRLDKGKGIDLFIPIFAEVRKSIPTAQLLLIGDGPLRRTLEGLCAHHGLSISLSATEKGAVYFAGYRTDPIRHYRLCNAFIFPSLHEGLGNALIEGVASGVPVLAADCFWGPRSILSEPGDPTLPDSPIELPHRLSNGLLMPMIDQNTATESWTLELVSILKSPRSRRALQDCHEAIRRFDIEETGVQWARLINDIVSSREIER